jgi:myo-inositol-1(or 4)-monophosphatase
MSSDSQRILKTAVEAARKAGLYLLDNWGKVTVEAADEKKKNDFVTFVDKTSEKMIIEYILSQFPGHQILAEEGGKQQSGSDYQWIIDPLDGTTNFIRHIPVFAVSIGVKYRNEIIAGVVFNPVDNELFSAAKGQGAHLNDAPIHVSRMTDFSRAFLATGFPHQYKRFLPQFVKSFSDIFFHSAGMRRLGSAALDLCYTACGRFEGFWEIGLNPWDIAAGGLIVQEAGGEVSDFWGRPSYLDSGFVVAGNSAIQKQLTNILSTYFEGNSNE